MVKVAEAKTPAEKRLALSCPAMRRAGFKEGQITRTLTQGGTVVALGNTNQGLLSTVPAGLSGVVAMAAGDHHGVALKQDGTVVAWGNNGYEKPKCLPS